LNIQENVSLAAHTSLGVGGPARYFALIENSETLVKVLEFSREGGLPILVLGGGSNILISDDGYPGVVIKLAGKFFDISREKDYIICGGAALSRQVARRALSHSFSGIEFLVGIPGTIGGAIFGNAGAYGGEIGSFVSEVTVAGMEGSLRTLTAKEIGFGYRRTDLSAGTIVTSCLLGPFDKGEPAKMEAIMKHIIDQRRKKEPKQRSCGSLFKNPKGKKAWEITHRLGLAGLKIGKASVSAEHANYVVNLGGATASDINEIIRIIQAKAEEAGTPLEVEVRMYGDFGE